MTKELTNFLLLVINYDDFFFRSGERSKITTESTKEGKFLKNFNIKSKTHQ
jgi:hypothetical protein